MKPHLEKTTEAFIKELEASGGKPLYTLSPQEARAVLEKLQAGPIDKPTVKIEDRIIPVSPKGEVSIRIVRPEKDQGMLPVIMYYHGGGWILGSDHTHDRLVRLLSVGTHAAVVFVNYTPLKKIYAKLCK